MIAKRFSIARELLSSTNVHINSIGRTNVVSVTRTLHSSVRFKSMLGFMINSNLSLANIRTAEFLLVSFPIYLDIKEFTLEKSPLFVPFAQRVSPLEVI